MAVKDIIKQRRKELGLTLLDIAEKVGVSEGTVSRWESGDISNMRRDKIADLAKALGTTPAYLMGWPEETTDKKISPDELKLTEGEKALIKLLRRVPAAEQPIVIEKILSALDDLG